MDGDPPKERTTGGQESGSQQEIYSLASKNSENYFSNQGANTLRSSSLSRNLRNQGEGIPKWRQFEK